MHIDPKTLIGPDGRPLGRRTESEFPARLFEMLQALEPTLSQQGVALVCVRCGGYIHGQNHPSDPVFYLDCQCARRTFDRVAQKQRATLNEDAPIRVQ